MTSRKKPGLAFWATVALLVVALYVLSIGPVAWLVREAKPGDWSWSIYHAAYYPLHRIRELGERDEDPALDSPAPIGRAIDWYLNFWGGGPMDWMDT